MFFFEPNYSNCEPCNIKNLRKVKGNSTPRDVIMGTAFGKLLGIIPFLRSMRTCGCKARLVIFVDKKAMEKYPRKYYEKINDCGGELVLCPYYKGDIMYGVRYQAYRDFLLNNRYNIDRVITLDLFDTIMQYDPFIPSFRNDVLYFEPENITVKMHPYNVDWVKDAHKILGENLSQLHFQYNGDPKDLMEWEVLNGGEQAGGPDQLLAYIDHLCKFLGYGSNDQGFAIYFYQNGIFKEVFDFESIRLPVANDIFVGVGVRLLDGYMNHWKTKNHGEFELGGHYPGLIHQFDRSREVASNIKRACPNNYDPPFDDYIRSN
jgi:hypothetical protein